MTAYSVKLSQFTSSKIVLTSHSRSNTLFPRNLVENVQVSSPVCRSPFCSCYWAIICDSRSKNQLPCPFGCKLQPLQGSHEIPQHILLLLLIISQPCPLQLLLLFHAACRLAATSKALTPILSSRAYSDPVTFARQHDAPASSPPDAPPPVLVLVLV